MAVNITCSSANSAGYDEAIRSARPMEIVKLQGASTAINDTGTYTSKLQNPAIVIGGGFAASFSGQVVTFTALFALGSNANHLIIAEAQ